MDAWESEDKRRNGWTWDSEGICTDMYECMDLYGIWMQYGIWTFCPWWSCQKPEDLEDKVRTASNSLLHGFPIYIGRAVKYHKGIVTRSYHASK